MPLDLWGSTAVRVAGREVVEIRAGNRSIWVCPQPETLALLARMGVAPTRERVFHIDVLIASLREAGIWSKLDTLYVLAGHEAQASRLNWVQPAYNLTAVNSPVFTPDRGWQGDGAASYLASGFNSAIAGNRFAQNSAHVGIWSLTNMANGAANSGDIGARNGGSGTDYTISRFGAASPGGAVMGAGNVGAAYGASTPVLYPGHVSWSRTGSAAWNAFSDGSVVGSGVNISAAPHAVEFRVLAATGRTYGVNRLAVAHWGAGLTPVEMLAFRNALRTYLVSVGAIAP